ncbi:MAG TPA: radical SAM protein, partial [Candidatus Binatia bacterium]|nr:radical SAM protein [Candidatus Binatia bacterium]
MTPHRPYTLVAELTYRCPLRCSYCSNPLDWARRADALDARAWGDVLAQAEALGVVQVHFTGGEPLLRPDLERLVEAARRLDLYSQLVTSGVPLVRDRLVALRRRGLDVVQLSFQDAGAAAADALAGRAAHERKIAVARWVKDLGMPLTINVVVHRANVDRVADVIGLAEMLGADR